MFFRLGLYFLASVSQNIDKCIKIPKKGIRKSLQAARRVHFA